MKEEKVVLNEAMIRRSDELDNAAYQYFMTLLGVDEKEAETQFPWNVYVLRELLDAAVAILAEEGLAVCNPAIITEKGETRLCNLTDCGCKVCRCVDKILKSGSIVEKDQKN